jgi:hypothetical protein
LVKSLEVPSKLRLGVLIGVTVWALWLWRVGLDHFYAIFSGMEAQALLDGKHYAELGYLYYQRRHLHPPVTGYLLRAWALLNTNEEWVRLFPVLCGLGSSILVAQLVALRHGLWVAAAAALCFSGSLAFLELHAQFLNYGWPILLCAALLLTLELYLRSRSERWLWLLSALSGLAAVSEYATLFLTLPLWGYVVGRLWSKHRNLRDPELRRAAVIAACWLLPTLAWVIRHRWVVEMRVASYLIEYSLHGPDPWAALLSGHGSLVNSLFPGDLRDGIALLLCVSLVACAGLLPTPRSDRWPVMLALGSYALTLLLCALMAYPWVPLRHRLGLLLTTSIACFEGGALAMNALARRIPLRRFRPFAMGALLIALLFAATNRASLPPRMTSIGTAHDLGEWARAWNAAVLDADQILADWSTFERVQWYAAYSRHTRLVDPASPKTRATLPTMAQPQSIPTFSVYSPGGCEALRSSLREHGRTRWAIAALRSRTTPRNELERCVRAEPELARAIVYATNLGLILVGGDRSAERPRR